MKPLLRRMSLTAKLLLLPLIAILLMGLGLGAAAVYAIQTSYETRVQRIIEQTVEESSRYVSAELRNTVNLVHYSLLDGRLQQALASDLSGADMAEYITAQDVITSVLTQLQAQGRFIESAALTAQGQLFSGGLHDVRYDMAPLLDAAGQSGLATWSDATVVNEASGREVIPLVLRVPTGDFFTRNEAYILINLDAEMLFSYIGELERSLECALILHSGDTILYDPGGLYQNLDHNAKVVNDTRLEINNWSLFCVMDRSQLYASRNIALAHMAAAAVVIGIFCLAFSLLVARSILRPVRGLTRAAGLVAKGDYAVRIEEEGTDELSQLARAFNTMTAQIHANVAALEEKNRQIARGEQQKRQAEMRALQAQINPHFLYNTLDSVYWYALSGRQKETGVLVETLSDMLRIALSKGSEYIPLEKEIRHMEDYLRIQSTIFPGRFTYTVENTANGAYHVLKVLLQPLVENSINHGFADREQGGRIAVRIREEGDFLCLCVQDNGCGFAQAAQQAARSEYAGFALHNLEERLQVHYGADAALTIRSEPDRETCVEIRIRRSRCLAAAQEGESL